MTTWPAYYPPVRFDPERLAHIRTRFLRDRLRETAFAHRDAFAELSQFEALAVLGGPPGWPDIILHRHPEQTRTVACVCSVEEILFGRYTAPEAYRARLARHQGRADAERAERQRDEPRLEAERRAWLQAGGGLA